MKLFRWLTLLFVLSCTSEKKSESTATDSLTIDSMSSQNQSANVANATDPDVADPDPITYDTVVIPDNPWLKDYIISPFDGIGIDSIVSILKSQSLDVEFVNGENGEVKFDNSSISFNRSYGDSYCFAEINSARIPLGNGLSIGMTKEDFLNKVNFSPSVNKSNQSFKFSDLLYEKTYSINFGFVDNVLQKFTYSTEPCVIYD